MSYQPSCRPVLGLVMIAMSVLGVAGCQMPGPAGPPYLVAPYHGDGPGELADVSGTLFFVGFDPAHGTELWRSDGTPEGTRLVKDARPGDDQSQERSCSYCSIGPSNLTRIGRRLFFAMRDRNYGWEPWVSNGTEAGTRLAEDISPGEAPSLTPYDAFADLRGTALFFAHQPGFGRELWRSDGTPQGTRLVRDIVPGPDGPSLVDLFARGNRVYFEAEDGVHGREPWGSDGTERGTVLLADVAPGPSSSYMHGGFVQHQRSGLVYFTVYDQQDWALWRTDGTPRGTAPVAKLPGQAEVMEGGDGLLLTVEDDRAGEELWTSDGTSAGTRLLKDICPGSCDSYADHFLRLGEIVLFSAHDEEHGMELWRSDGTPAGTVLLRDLVPGPDDSYPDDFVRAGSLAYFVTYNGRLDRAQLWMTDGTAAGTQVVPGTEDRYPLRPTVSGHRLFFVDCSSHPGCELWAMEVN